MNKTVFISILLITLRLTLYSQDLQIKWQRCFGGSNEERVMDILPVGSEYFIVGWTESDDGDISFNHGSGDAWIVKIDSIGNILWEKTYGGSNGEFWRRILPAPDNCYYLLGASGSWDGDISYDPYPGSNDLWIAKIDSAGTLIWEKIIGGWMIDMIESAALTNDGGVVVFGWTGSQDGEVTINYGMYDMWLVKLNSDGDIEWDKSFGTDDFDYGHAIISTPDGGFLIGGASTIGSGGNLTCEPYNLEPMAILIKLDSMGNIEWQNCYGGSGHDGIYGLIELNDGYAFTAFTTSPDGDVTGWHGSYDIWVVRLDTSGNIIWEQCFGGTDSEIAHHLFVNTNGDFTIIGKTSSNNGDVSGNNSVGVNNDIWVFRIDNQGFLLSQQCFGGIGNEAVNGHKFGVAQKSDNNFVIATITNYGPSFDVGCTPYGGNGDIDYWVFEIMLDDTVNTITPAISAREIRVYPNPAKDYLHFEVEGLRLEGAKLGLYDVFGRQVTGKEITSEQNILDVSGMPGGVYYYRVVLGEETYSGKIVIHR